MPPFFSILTVLKSCIDTAFCEKIHALGVFVFAPCESNLKKNTFFALKNVVFCHKKSIFFETLF